jgi:sugar phosphate permease
MRRRIEYAQRGGSLSLVAAPAAAQAQAAEAPAAAIEPAAEEVEGSEIRGGFILPTLGIIALIAAIILLTKGDDDPVSA